MYKYMVMKDNGCKKKRKLDWKCKYCHERFSIAELLELGYAEKLKDGLISIECPNGDNVETIKKNNI